MEDRSMMHDARSTSSCSEEVVYRGFFTLATTHSGCMKLLDLEQDDESVISTLSMYVWDLFDGRSVRDIH
jgi:hypothetical protein